MEHVCQYNAEVVCDHKKCYHCGWDPEVAKARQDKIRGDMMNGNKLYRVPFTGYCEVWAKSPEEAADKAEDIGKQFTAYYAYGDPICLEKEEKNELD